MTKQCATDGCTEEIQDWQTYCSKHYAQMMQKTQQQQQQPQPPPQEEIVTEERVVDVQEPKKIKSAQQKIDLPELVERERLIVKQTALKSAIELLKTMDNENKEFEQLMNEIETLTVYFYRVIVLKNEQ
jgi:hypothetical protein